ncbi:hypothetical protein G3I43_22205 [Streptomyces anulatus]|uniref:Condensation domain-containing protein n=1 Tax=Streptomyces anulatus TaxID=1892 RepID=A0A6G3SV23_STRAQ|nr:condensation domain-containing protein [Streptomyces anulatus]NEB86866.1 hypothetical protein [Streptomyces anulatus]
MTRDPLDPVPAPVTSLPLSARQDWCWSWLRCYPRPYPQAPDLAAPLMWHFRGRLDVEALRQALSLMARKHETLRYTLELSGGTARLALLPDPLPLEIVPADMAERVLALPGPLATATLARTADDEHLLALHWHHLIYDQVSVELFRKELASTYRSLVESGEGPDTASPFDYRAFAQEERVTADREERIQRAASTLRDHGALEPLSKGRAGEVERAYGHMPMAVDESTTSQLLARCRTERVSLFTALAAALGVAVGRVHGRDRIIVSAHHHGRNRPGSRGALGLFANVVNLPLELDRSDRAEMLSQARAKLAEATSTVSLPFSRLCEATRGTSTSSGYLPSALSHVWLRLDGVSGWWPAAPSVTEEDWCGVRVSTRDQAVRAPQASPRHIVAPDAVGAGAALVVGMQYRGGRLVGTMKYETGHFPTEVVSAGVVAFAAEIDAIARGGRGRVPAG